MMDEKQITQKKTITVAAFRDYGNITNVAFLAPEGIDAEKAILDAAKEAERDGLRFTLSAIPEKYLNRQGLKPLEVKNIELEDHRYGRTIAEDNGIWCAACRDCDSFEDGSCYRYGGICDPDNSPDDCIHGDNIVILGYNIDENVPIWIPLMLDDPIMDKLDNADKTNPWIVEQLQAEDNEWSETIKQITTRPDYDPNGWTIRKTRS